MDLTRGNLLGKMLQFSVPYLIACFLQTFYGMADLFITGLFRGADSISAVAVGSQVMHMLTVVTAGFAMGATVSISRSVGAGDRKRASSCVRGAVLVFLVFAAVEMVLLFRLSDLLTAVLEVPPEALAEAKAYLLICFAGIPFITAYNVQSSIFRGYGDTRRPMYFVAAAGVLNIGLDYLLIGPMHMGAAGAALATVTSQAVSVLMAGISLRKQLKREAGESGNREKAENKDPEKENNGKSRKSGKDGSLPVETGPAVREILSVGIPVAFQEGLIQVSFLVITAIANSRGVSVAAAVGIVEKVICFLFLVPSAMLSTVSAVAAQNRGAGEHARGRKALYLGCLICFMFGAVVFLSCQAGAERIVGLFAPGDPEVVRLGGQYLRSYTVDCMIAGIHFCFSGYFSAYGRSGFSFLHNILSVVLVRIPGAYLASVCFPETLYPMGLAAPAGSLLSVVICVFLFRRFFLQSVPVGPGAESGGDGHT